MSVTLTAIFLSSCFVQSFGLLNRLRIDTRCPCILMAKNSESLIAQNRKASFEYEWTETYEAGIMLLGTEVKSCRKGTVQLSDGFAEIIDGECWLTNVHIAEHQRCGPYYQHEPKRKRKLLLHAREILKIEQRVLQRNCVIIPIKMYFTNKNFVKIELGIGKTKSFEDKRDDIEKREGDREIRRAIKYND